MTMAVYWDDKRKYKHNHEHVSDPEENLQRDKFLDFTQTFKPSFFYLKQM